MHPFFKKQVQMWVIFAIHTNFIVYVFLMKKLSVTHKV